MQAPGADSQLIPVATDSARLHPQTSVSLLIFQQSEGAKGIFFFLQ